MQKQFTGLSSAGSAVQPSALSFRDTIWASNSSLKAKRSACPQALSRTLPKRLDAPSQRRGTTCADAELPQQVAPTVYIYFIRRLDVSGETHYRAKIVFKRCRQLKISSKNNGFEQRTARREARIDRYTLVTIAWHCLRQATPRNDTMT